MKVNCLTNVRAICILLLTTLISVFGNAEDNEDRRPLEHEDYANWKSISSSMISNTGDWICYSQKPGKGDAILFVRHNRSDKEYKILRGQSAKFSFDGSHIGYVVTPDPELIKKLKKEKKADGQLPKSHLEILNLKSGKKLMVQNVTSFSMPAKGNGWVAFKLDDSKSQSETKPGASSATGKFIVTEKGLTRPEKMAEPKPSKSHPNTTKKKEAKKKETKAKSPTAKTSKKKSNGSTLVILNYDSAEQFRFPWTTNFRFNEKGDKLAFATSGPNASDDGVSLFDLNVKKKTGLISGKGEYQTPVFDKEGAQLAFASNRDSYNEERPTWAIYSWHQKQKTAKKLIDVSTSGLPKNWWIVGTTAPIFTEDGSALYIRTAPRPEKENKPDEDAPEKAKLDIWHWQDPLLQPQQKLLVQREKNRSYLAKVDLRSRKFIQLAKRNIPNVSFDPRSKSRWAIGVNPKPHDKSRSWDYPGYNDNYLVDLRSGTSRKIVIEKLGTVSLSPDGKFAYWWDGEKRTWFSLDTASVAKNAKAEPVDLGKSIPFPLFNELHDSPSNPRSYGIAGWLADESAILVYDRWDIWQVDPTGRTKATNLTNGYGRTNQVRLRLIKLDSESRHVHLDGSVVLSGLDHKTKASGFFQLNVLAKPSVRKLIWLDENVSELRKAKNSNDVFFTRSTFRRFPDIWSSKLASNKKESKTAGKGFGTIQRISNANPQQRDVRWGTAELVRWKSTDGQSLDGILYKPDGFDPKTKHPMIVYFYERYSDRLHTHYAPAAGRSIINFSFYVSRGYIVFVPDIPYQVGQPGPSAANSVLPGVQHLIAQGFVDPKRIGMQGHSWGGYQTAYLVTQTNLFACAESGAPVSNMTSAYGGIRWGSGMSRMFQYEKTQSRIGDTLWHAREKYIANSPLFHADKIETPLLILHNDKDTAVPWYQGIELFVALRRLEKPAWMLNYNDDPHWVMGDANRLDFAKRMQQFFDHYLKGKPMPEWMANGIPAVDKGKKYGFEPAAQKD